MQNLKVTIDRAALAEAGAWVAGAIARNPDSPAMAGMLVQAVGGAVFLSGYDNQTAHRATIPADVKSPGEVLVSGRFLVSIVAALKGVTVELEVSDGRLSLYAGRSTYRMGLMPADTFPQMPEFPTHVGTMDAETLTETLGTAEHAASKDTGLLALTAYNLTGDAGHLSVVTTDRFRLARVSAPWADASASAFSCNVPAVSISAAVKGLTGSVEMGTDGKRFGLRDATRSVVTTVLGDEQKFPKVGILFEKAPLVEVEVEVEPLMEALKRARLVTEVNGAVIVEFSDGLVTVTSDAATSDGSEEVDCPVGFGEGSMSLRFNADHLGQALAASPAPSVRFGLTEPGKQVLLHPVGSESVAMIVMPRQATK